MNELQLSNDLTTIEQIKGGVKNARAKQKISM